MHKIFSAIITALVLKLKLNLILTIYTVSVDPLKSIFSFTKKVKKYVDDQKN